MTYQETFVIFEDLFSAKIPEPQARKLLIDLYERGESAEEIAAAASVMRAHAVSLPIEAELREELIDNVGTGGDKSGSFNISSTVSLLLASCGCKVAKHGNRSVTSRSGSADMLEALGICLDLGPKEQVIMLEETGFCFMFAANYHPAMKFIMPIRKSLPHRTIFNILGPLTNPAGVKKQVVGVFSSSFIDKVANALRLMGSKRAMVVSSRDGLDEISISDISYYAFYDGQEIYYGEIIPENLGIKKAPLEAILGENAIVNAQITTQILEGKTQGPKRDIVLLNAAAALLVDGKARDLKEGIEMALEAIESGRAKRKLEEIIKISEVLKGG